MKIIRSVESAQKYFAALKVAGKTLGFVPTMGALHAGHAALIKRAVKENAAAAVSIFVNPTQFGRGEDFAVYPRNFAADAALCRACGVKTLFYPSSRQMYPYGFSSRVTAGPLGGKYCGNFRRGHFDGVATVVAKLFNIVRPARAYFGEKDYQQLRIIERITRDLDFAVEIVACPTVREPDGLAMSSRNVRLAPENRKNAPLIYRVLSAAKKAPAWFAAAASRKGLPPPPCPPPPRLLESKIMGVLGEIKGAYPEYVAAVEAATLEPLKKIPRDPSEWRILAAVRMGKVRLIDNV